MKMMSDKFVCGYRDITGLPWAGSSDMHQPDTMAVATTNGAGPHNIQMFFLSADGTVLHCLLGYWNPDDLQSEAKLAEKLNQVWLSKTLTIDQKNSTFKQLQLAHIEEHSPETTARSKLQSFDEHTEGSKPKSDFVVAPFTKGHIVAYESHGTLFKTTDAVIHERMAKRPFLPYSEFDIVAYSDYGSRHYDKSENAYTKRMNDMANADALSAYSRPTSDPRVRQAQEARAERELEQLKREFPEDGLSATDKKIMSTAGTSVVNRGVMSYSWSTPNNSNSQATATTASVPNRRSNSAVVNYNWTSSTPAAVDRPNH